MCRYFVGSHEKKIPIRNFVKISDIVMMSGIFFENTAIKCLFMANQIENWVIVIFRKISIIPCFFPLVKHCIDILPPLC